MNYMNLTLILTFEHFLSSFFVQFVLCCIVRRAIMHLVFVPNVSNYNAYQNACGFSMLASIKISEPV